MLRHQNPPPVVTELLATELELTAWHEAGHAVAYAVTGLPLHSVSLRYQSRWRMGRQWKVAGVTRLAAVRPVRIPDSWREPLAVAALAGPEAEARRLHETSGMPLGAARREADLAGARYDLRDAAADLKRTPLTLADARENAASLVAGMWPVIGVVAALMQPGRALPGSRVRELTRQAVA
jgi:hypothetical protein